MVGDKLDVLFHQVTVHSNQIHRQGLRKKLLQSETCAFVSFYQNFSVWFVHAQGKVVPTDLLNADGFSDDVLYPVLRRLLDQVAVEQARKCTVQALQNNINAIRVRLTPHSWWKVVEDRYTSKDCKFQTNTNICSTHFDYVVLSVCQLTSSLLISSFEYVRPGMSPLFFSQ